MLFRSDALGNDSVYLYLKALYPDKFSVYNGLAIGYDSIPYDAEGLVTQVKDMIAAGFDGLKMINNRSTKDTWGFEFDDMLIQCLFLGYYHLPIPELFVLYHPFFIALSILKCQIETSKL